MTAPQKPHIIHVERAADMPPLQMLFNPVTFLHRTTASQQADGFADLRDWLGAVLQREQPALCKGKSLSLYQRLYESFGQMRRSVEAARDIAMLDRKPFEALSIANIVPFSTPEQDLRQQLQPLPPEEMIEELKAMRDLAKRLASPSSAPYRGDRRLLEAWCHMVLETVVMPIQFAIACEEEFLREIDASFVKGAEPDAVVMGKHTREWLKNIAASPQAQPGRGKS